MGRSDMHWEMQAGKAQRQIGALVGGPDPSHIYRDDRTDAQSNEVAVDYNAGFTGRWLGKGVAVITQRQVHGHRVVTTHGSGPWCKGTREPCILHSAPQRMPGLGRRYHLKHVHARMQVIVMSML